MKKIAIIIDNISNKAGTERAVSNLTNGLISFYPKAYDITIISIFTNPTETSFYELNSSIKIIHLNKKEGFKLYNKIFWYNSFIKNIKSINNEYLFDVLMGTTYVHNILLPIICKKTSTKMIGCEHVTYHYPSKLIQKIRNYVYKRLDSLVVLSEEEQKFFNKLSNTFVIPNSLPFDSKIKSNQNNKTIIAVGRLTHQKGFSDLIHIFEKIHSVFRDWQLIIFGEGEEYNHLLSIIENKNLTKVIKIHKNVQNISDFYQKSSIFAQTSYTESFGLALLEAMNHGLAVISYENEGAKKLIKPNINGLLVTLFDKDDYEKKLIQLIESKNFRFELANQAIESTSIYKEINIIPLWNKHIHSIIKKA
ncbi:glycosyltransferase [Empedobacter brevis]|nr:glycosyltransferase [Empedobacter brevis]